MYDGNWEASHEEEMGRGDIDEQVKDKDEIGE